MFLNFIFQMIKKIFFLIVSLFLIQNIYSQTETKKIVYSSDNTENGYLQIFVMDADGSNKKQLSNLFTNCIYPKWSPDGNKIIFHTEDDKSVPSIFVIRDVNSDTPSEPVYVTDGTNPVILDDEETIIYNSDIDGILTIYIKFHDEAEGYPISPTGYSNQQKLTPDHRYMAYSTYLDDGKGIVLMDLDDTTDNNLWRISFNNNANMHPDISPDGDILVYSSFNEQLNGTIYLYRDGKEISLSKEFKSADQPKFSPDMKKIGFIVIDDMTIKLYTMNLDGSEKKYLKVKGGNVGHFLWADSNTILYDVEDGSSYKIGTVDINSEESKILAGDGNCLEPDIYTSIDGE